ncbi:surface lipoprotein assembly modifier [Hephaestia sp. GCM10023244]|uniref:surface lipoprotein assembly modifier n=1 Tax=unclassified Hephaestia TaxID=2631281 RepID=UPI0020771D48|nr:surface lipoprotein assembly modifier [Hephaestia sp. MAHUQ-44]MCM8729933.1 surface lipoprotein assembly modifier [Hephaestia sp. MAHUQ-44]
MWGQAVAVATALLAAVVATPTAAQTTPECEDGTCRIQLTPQQLQAAAERLVRARKFEEAKPLVAALRQAPGFTMQSRFLTGYIAAETGHPDEAAEHYRAILNDDPGQTGVRLALAKAMLALHKPGDADRQFKIAEQDQDLPPEVLRTIRTVRDTIRAQRPWQIDISVGLAPDTNINNATSLDTIRVNLGNDSIPLTLDDRARAKSGIGQTAQISGRLRLPAANRLSILADLDANGTNYAGADYDDYVAQLAAGVEYALTPQTHASIEAVGAHRWYGGDAVSRQIGTRLGLQTTLSPSRRVGVQLDLRRTEALFDDRYSGWQGGVYATYEQALAPTLLVSAGPFVRRDWLNDRAYSNTETGANIGIGGAMPLGINFGLRVGASRAVYDAPVVFFDVNPRRDWRLVARATLGNRKIRLLGLSPQIGFSWTRIDSTIGFYDATRGRFEITLARYF